jgi:hypothetical protein
MESQSKLSFFIVPWQSITPRCAHCHTNIAKGSPRIHVCFRPPNDWIYHRCLPCLTEQILSNIIAEWSEFSDPMKAFVAAQPPEVVSYFRNMNPNKSQAGPEEDQAFVIEKLHQFAEEELTMTGQKRSLQTLKDGETTIVPVGKMPKRFPPEG